MVDMSRVILRGELNRRRGCPEDIREVVVLLLLRLLLVMLLLLTGEPRPFCRNVWRRGGGARCKAPMVRKLTNCYYLQLVPVITLNFF